MFQRRRIWLCAANPAAAAAAAASRAAIAEGTSDRGAEEVPATNEDGAEPTSSSSSKSNSNDAESTTSTEQQGRRTTPPLRTSKSALTSSSSATPKTSTPIQFFNEAFFRPIMILNLTPENLLTQLARLPKRAKILRVYGSSFYVTLDCDVIGILSPMMCQAVPFSFPVGGITIEDYILFLQHNKSVLINVVTSGSTMVGTVDPNGDPIIGPHIFRVYPEGHHPEGIESMKRMYSDAPFYQEFFGWYKAYHHEVNECGTFWVKTASQQVWRDIVRTHSGWYSKQLYEVNFRDKRWLPTTPHMYFPKIYDFETKEIDVDGVFDRMRSGQIALKIRV